MITSPVAPVVGDGFRHESLLYAGDREFLAAVSAFLRDAARAGEPTLVVVDADKIAALRAQVDGAGIAYADMAEVGANPARIIAAWRAFVADHGPGPVRGIGEPIWPGRSSAELVECQRHEALLNLAFADASLFWLLCPYDTAALDVDVIAEARRTHPFVSNDDGSVHSTEYPGLADVAGPFDDPLPEPSAVPAEFGFGPGQLGRVRAFVAAQAAAVGLGDDGVSDVVLVANELATNSLLYGGGDGSVRLWCDDGAVICEVRDAGVISDPLIGRLPPSGAQQGGRGLWMANQLCDLVQVRSSQAGTVVRVHVGRS